MRISDGDIVHFSTDDFAGGQIGPDSTHSDLLGLDFDAIYPLSGPVFVEGAEPGDVLAVEILELRPADWGWACIIPGLGLLPQDEFAQPYLKIFDLRSGDTTALGENVRIPIEPFLGTMGVVPENARAVPVPPPHAGGGNIDLRHLTAGATLLLPVFEPGALFSAGDAHAAQGDGEVAISGIECAMEFTLRFRVLKGLSIPAPQLRRPAGSLTPRVDAGGWYATFGVEPDLIEGSRQAVRAMLDTSAASTGSRARTPTSSARSRETSRSRSWSTRRTGWWAASCRTPSSLRRDGSRAGRRPPLTRTGSRAESSQPTTMAAPSLRGSLPARVVPSAASSMACACPSRSS